VKAELSHETLEGLASSIATIERYIKQLERALAATWHALEELHEPIQEAGIASTFDDLRDRYRDAIERVLKDEELPPDAPEGAPPAPTEAP
jgi:hypothetical protein